MVGCIGNKVIPACRKGNIWLSPNYKDAYAQAAILPYEQETGWQADCGGFIEKKILFGEKPESYSIYGTNSVRIRNKAIVTGGNIGALEDAGEVDIEENVLIHSGVKIIGKTVSLSSTAKVDSIYYDVLDDKGATILGDICSPLIFDPEDPCGIPSWQRPLFHSDSNKSKVDLVINSGDPPKTLSISENIFRDVTLESRAVLKLTAGGIYYFNSLSLGSDSQVICLGPVEIQIKERVNPGSKAYLGPSPVHLPPSAEGGGVRLKRHRHLCGGL